MSGFTKKPIKDSKLGQITTPHLEHQIWAYKIYKMSFYIEAVKTYIVLNNVVEYLDG